MGILVRFVTGELEGERISALRATVDDEGKPTIEGEQGTAKATGRFIEVVTPGPTPQQAEQHAYAALGLLAVALGPNVIGGVVFSEPWETTSNEQLGAMVAKGTAFARRAEVDEIGEVDKLLARLTADGPVARSLVIGLRWYERGLRSTEPLGHAVVFLHWYRNARVGVREGERADPCRGGAGASPAPAESSSFPGSTFSALLERESGSPQ
jgi:hypothetical protein